MSFFYRAFFLLCLMVAFVPSAEAGNTRSANVGDPIPTLYWNVAGAPECIPDTSYTYSGNADGIRNSWVSLSPRPTTVGTHNFENRLIGAPAGTYTFTCTAGTVFDTSTLIVCDNVTQESDGASACVAKTPAVPTTLTAAPQACGTGQINLSWDPVPGATAYTLRDGATVIYTGAATSYSHTGLTEGSLHSYTVRAQNGALNSAYSAAVDATAPAICTFPNLIVAATNFPTGPLYQGVGVTIGGTIQNTGGAATPMPVYSNISYQWGGTGGAWTEITEFNDGILDPGDSSPKTYTFTPSGSGTLYLQFCVDSRNQIDEGAEETPNCVVSSAITVLEPAPGTPTGLTLNTTPVPACGGRMTASWNAVPGATSYKIAIDSGAYVDIGNVLSYEFTGLIAGSLHTIEVVASNSTGDSLPVSDGDSASDACTTLTVGTCTIADLARTCNTTVTWDITGAASPNIYNLTRSAAVPGTNMATGTSVTITLERSLSLSNELNGQNVIEARDGSNELQTRTVVASCGATSFFHTDGSEDRCQPNPNILITPNPAWIRSGDQANLTFGILANYPGVTCTFSGAMSAAASIVHTASASRTNYVRTTDPLTAAQVVRVSCEAPGLLTPVTGQVRVNVLPDVQEI